jgi:hypothetical protein
MIQLFSLCGFVFLVVATLLPVSAAVPGKVRFNRDVRPILSENCFACHGPDKNQRKAKLRLDQRDNAIEKKAIVPFNANESSLVTRIVSPDDLEVMPPPETHKKLTAGQKDILKQWIQQGAEYEAHWAYITPTRPVVPGVKQQPWVRTPIDAFILAKLEGYSLSPSPEADRATLVRRLSLDLIGLPPTPEEVQAALADQESNWYEKVVDRLLASPHYGERMAVPWLDVVRFSDTVGFHGDQNQRIFPYRDYVINAFNQNMPFDQFTREQLAGDLLPNPTVDQRIATGFNRLNMMTREGGAQPKEYLAKYAADRVRAVAVTWLGSTVGCAECHDHKYDPFTQKDFYSLSAYFADLKQWGVYQDYNYTPNPDLKNWSNDHPWPPELEVENPALKRRMERVQAQIEETASKVAASVKPEQLATWQKQAERGWVTPKVDVTFGDAPAPKRPAKAPAKAAAKDKSEAKKPAEPAKDEPEVATVQLDGSVLITGPIKQVPTVQVPLPAGWLAAIKLELLPHEEHKKSILRNKAGNVTFKPAFFLRKKGGTKDTPIAIRFADADRREPIYRNGFDLLGVTETWRTVVKEKHQPHLSLWWLDQPVEAAEGDQLVVKIPTNLLGCVRVSVSAAAPVDIRHPEVEVTRSTPALFLRSTGWHGQAFAEVKRLEQQFHECRHGMTFTMVSESTKPLVTRVLARGNWLDEKGAIVEPATPHFLGSSPQRSEGRGGRGALGGAPFLAKEAESRTPLPNPPPQGGRGQTPQGDSVRFTRLDLANWLTSPENPLTARVFVNRLWKQFFGTGLSSKLDDLGAQGEWPTHPELLDWLAVEFRESGWNVKHMVKLMVMSNVYRQSAVRRTDIKTLDLDKNLVTDIDPENRLLAAQSPRRLEAEFVRDQALFAAGLLNREQGGPSAFPYQPAGYYAQLQFPDRDYKPDRDERQYRRGVYSHWQRTFLHPMLANFDAPPREECVACRTVANTPQQALTLLNDPSFVEAARTLAQRVIEERQGDEARLERAFWRVLSRGPKAKEKESLLKLLASHRDYYKNNPKEAELLLKVGYAPRADKTDTTELAAWTSVTRVLLNLHETITRY